MLKTGFDCFFASLRALARRRGSSVQPVAAKDGLSAFRKAMRSHPNAWNVLLKDSEMPVPNDRRVLLTSHGIDDSHTANVFWMVELMESWFLADPEAVEIYYGLSSNSMQRTADVERLSKRDVQRRLKQVTRRTSKGEYHKVKHAPYLLQRLDAQRVQACAEHCRELFNRLATRM